MNTVLSKIHKGRWGWYSTSYEIYLKLKELNKQVNRYIRQLAAWERWNRKDPKNRVIRPKLRNNLGQVVGFGAPIPRPEPIVDSLEFRSLGNWYNINKRIQEDYANARMPRPSESMVQSLKLSEDEIDYLYKQLK